MVLPSTRWPGRKRPASAPVPCPYCSPGIEPCARAETVAETAPPCHAPAITLVTHRWVARHLLAKPGCLVGGCLQHESCKNHPGEGRRNAAAWAAHRVRGHSKGFYCLAIHFCARRVGPARVPGSKTARADGLQSPARETDPNASSNCQLKKQRNDAKVEWGRRGDLKPTRAPERRNPPGAW
jgi:hypothetical protein